MGTYNSAVITTAGQSLLARAIADNLPFYMTSAKTTEYVVPTGTSAASLTELPNVKQSEDITSATVSGGNQVVTSVRFDNTEITLNYSINTIGVYARVGTDTEETLLAVITAITADVMPSYSAANPVSYVYSINLAISNASNINIVVSPTGTVNVAEFTELKERVDEIIDSGSGLSTDAKMALLNCFEHVAWIDEHGQTYYDTLHDALFPSAVSISATFTPGSHVFYETDSLDALRPYLIVRATMPDSTVEIVTDYILTGSMAVGTNTITVRYQGLTDTFEVTTQANPAYIEAVFTQPSATIYTDDSLDSLKSNLVVTYYSAPGATGTVLADSAYTLVGTLTEGTSVITASYQGLTDTFEVTNIVNAIIYQNSNVVFTGQDVLTIPGFLDSEDRSFTIAIDFTKQKSNSTSAMWTLINYTNDPGYWGLMFRRDQSVSSAPLYLKWMTSRNSSKSVPAIDYEGKIKLICVHTVGSNVCTYHWKFGSNSRDSLTLTDTFTAINNPFYMGGGGSQILIGTLNSIVIDGRAWSSSKIDSFFAS